MITLEFSIEELQIIDRALVALPYKDVAPIINSINAQLRKTGEQDDSEEQS